MAATLERTIGELVAERPARARVFEGFKIDYCCGGKKPLADACQAKGIDPQVVLNMLRIVDESAPTEERDWSKATITELCDNIESTLAPRVYRRCRYVTVSAATRDELAFLGVDPERVSIIHNGTPDMTTAGDVPRTAQPSLVALGRLVPHKQVEAALDAVAALAGELPGITLVIAGQGWWEPELRAYAARHGIADRVRFAGFVSDQEKRELLSQAWVALTPSLKEGWGLTIVEAAAVGTPTVAFRGAGGVEESLVDGRTGLLADDFGDYTAKVRMLLVDDTLRLAMGAAARTHAARFTWPAAGERFAALVEGAAHVPAPATVDQNYLVP